MISTDPIDIQGMRAAGTLARDVLIETSRQARVGITTNELNDFAHNLIIQSGAIPAPLNYKGFPKSICTSVNQVVCHGIPGPKKLKDGDYISIDVTVILDGYHGDTCRTVPVKTKNTLKERVSLASFNSMWSGIRQVKPGATLGDIGYAIQTTVEEYNYSVVRMFCGHGIGKKFHEEPQVDHYGNPGEGEVLVPGMFFTIEPMINAGGPECRILKDGWTAVTKDHTFSAQWEHTVMVTETGVEVMTE